MVTTYDPVEVDLPGELADADRWEDIIEDDCAACSVRCARDAFGLCRRCAERYRLLDAGCGQAVALVAALDGPEGVPVNVLAHLIACHDCRVYLSGLVEAVRVAELESTQHAEAPYAAGLAITAA